MEKLPEFLKPYFWDVKFSTLDIEEHRNFILKRVIDRGNTRALRWALAHYPVESIKEIIFKSRDVSRKTANFWAKILSLDPKAVICLRKPYSPTPFGP